MTPAGRGGMNVDVGNGQMVAATSAPPLGGGAAARGRASSVRRRLMSPQQPSPYAKRPEAYVQPGTAPLVPPKTNQELTNEVIQQKNAIEAMHKWVQSI